MATLTIGWAIVRGIGASLMHSACTFVQLDYRIVALIMPILLFIPINYIEYKKKKYLEENQL